MPVYLGAQGRGALLLAPSSENILQSNSVTSTRRNRSSQNILRIMGEMVRYNGYLPVKVILRANVERFSEAGEVIRDDYQLSFQSKSIPFAKKGGIFTVNSREYTLKTPLDRSSEGMQTWVVT